MRRREFVTLIGGAAAAWPLVARAQQTEPIRRIGVLVNRGADDAEGQARLAALKQGLEPLGWSDGRNVRIDVRWGEDDVERERKYAAELVALSPDVSWESVIPLGAVSSIPWPGQAATQPALCCLNTV